MIGSPGLTPDSSKATYILKILFLLVVVRVGGGGENVNREFEKTVRMYINNHLRCSNQNKKSL